MNCTIQQSNPDWNRILVDTGDVVAHNVNNNASETDHSDNENEEEEKEDICKTIRVIMNHWKKWLVGNGRLLPFE